MTATRLFLLRFYSAMLAMFCAFMLSLAATTTFADNDKEEDPVDRDLQGILPDFIPDGLTEDDFGLLEDNWADWADETSELVAEFYTSEDDEVRARRITLDRVNVKLRTMETSLGDAQYLSIYGPLADLYGRLARRIDVSQALLSTVEQDVSAVAQARYQSGLTGLATNARNLRSHFEGVVNGDKWIKYFKLDDVITAAESRDSSDDAIELLEEIQEKLDERTELEDEQREFLARDQVLSFEDALNDALALVEADDPEGYRDYLKDLAAQLLEAIEDYEGEPTSEYMQAIRNLYDDIRRSAPDGGATLTRAMRTHYLNYNLRVVMDETLMQDLIRDTRMESGFINDMVMEAHVTGCQWTDTTVNLDLKPSDEGVRFDLLLNGNIRTSAQGETHVATVYTSGRFCLNGRKSILFDGERFQTWPAVINVRGANCAYDAQTCMSWIPLLGGFTESIALNVADERSPETDAYARNKIYREAKTKFDEETVKMLGEAELKLESDVAGPLRAEGYYPDIKEFRSTETEMLMRTRLMESDEVGGGDTLPFPLYPTHGALVQIHQSLLNQIGDRLELDGKRFTPDELKAHLQAKAEKIAGKPVDLGNIFPEPPPDDATEPQDNNDADDEDEDDDDEKPAAKPKTLKIEEIIFHEKDAIRFQITGGQVVLLLNMGLKVEDKDEIPPQQLRLPITVTLEGDKIKIVPPAKEKIGVSPIGRIKPRERAQQIARAGIMRTKMEDTFKKQEVDTIFSLDVQDKQVHLRITDFRARAGWLSIIATDGITETGEPKNSDDLYLQSAQGGTKAVTR